MSISKQDFSRASTGNILVDGDGNRWEVTYVWQRGFDPMLSIRLENKEIKVHFSEGEIVDEDFRFIRALNQSNARLIS